MSIARDVAATVLTFMLAGCSTASAPFIAHESNGTLRLPEMPLHDPFVVPDTQTQTYWLFTRNEPRLTGDQRLGTMAYSSSDLEHWESPKIVFALPKGTWANDGAWAPEVHRWDGRWYLFATYYNENAVISSVGGRKTVRRSTLLAVSDRLDGPYQLVRNGKPLVDKARMTLDGTLYIDPAGEPWLVYAHEWVQVGDGTIEAMPLDDDLRSAGEPVVLFSASEANWVQGEMGPDGKRNLVTDGPQLHRTASGALLMLWSSYDDEGYVQSIARSASGSIEGPWEQLEPLVRGDSGHGMVFRDFDNRLVLVLHHPFHNARGRLYLVRDDADRLAVVRELTELDR